MRGGRSVAGSSLVSTIAWTEAVYFKGNVMLQADEPLAIPLWINGHAYLTMAPAFVDVCNPVSGEVLRRTPLCGAGEAQQAVAAAQAALVRWAAQPASARAAVLAAVGDALAGYAGHFAALIAQESGKEAAAADAEVAAAIALLRSDVADDSAGVVGIVGASASPLLAALRLAVPALLAGAVVVVRPAPETPSALFALAELSSRCALPGGVFSIVHGGQAAVDGLRAATGGRLLGA
jgi:acyl-CoA reductase-like NAD-dependent aldehyde dehydrogenase